MDSTQLLYSVNTTLHWHPDPDYLLLMCTYKHAAIRVNICCVLLQSCSCVFCPCPLKFTFTSSIECGRWQYHWILYLQVAWRTFHFHEVTARVAIISLFISRYNRYGELLTFTHVYFLNDSNGRLRKSQWSQIRECFTIIVTWMLSLVC